MPSVLNSHKVTYTCTLDYHRNKFKKINNPFSRHAPLIINVYKSTRHVIKVNIIIMRHLNYYLTIPDLQ